MSLPHQEITSLDVYVSFFILRFSGISINEPRLKCVAYMRVYSIFLKNDDDGDDDDDDYHYSHSYCYYKSHPLR